MSLNTMATQERKGRRVEEVPVIEYGGYKIRYYGGRAARWLTNTTLKFVGGVTLLGIAAGGIMDASGQAVSFSVPSPFGEVEVGFGDRETLYEISPGLLERNGMLPGDRYDSLGTLVFDVRQTGLERGGDIFTVAPIASPAPQT